MGKFASSPNDFKETPSKSDLPSVKKIIYSFSVKGTRTWVNKHGLEQWLSNRRGATFGKPRSCSRCNIKGSGWLSC